MTTSISPRLVLLLGASASLGASSAPVWAQQMAPRSTVKGDNNTQSPFLRPLTGDRAIVHVLNRLGFGPRPGDVEKLRKIGISAYIEGQLKPGKIDDSALDTELADFTWLRAPSTQLTLAYESDESNILQKLRKAQDGKIKEAPTLNPRQQATLQRIQDANLPAHASVQALGQLSADKMARAISSQKQLQEVLVDFWGNHFNEDIKKGPVRALKIRDDRDVIRPNVFGTFRQLLGASAHSPAMLWYLDNYRSTREMPTSRGPKAKMRGGINENYGRELMELHTLGVDGGYTQNDVTEVARCFTGWSINPDDSTFVFRARAHDDGEKTVLGQKIPAGGGENDGERVLDILAQSPSTAKFIARKLCVRFVADNPPDGLVTKIAGVFTRTGGDLTSVYRAIFNSPEFLSEGAYRAKIKSPFEFTVSAVRALDGSFLTDDNREQFRLIATGAASIGKGGNAMRRLPKRPMASEIAAMGQPLFSCQPPTGYSEDSTKWVSSAALVARLNFALSLTAGQIGDVVLNQDTFRPAPVDTLATSLLDGDISPSTRTTIQAEAQKTPGDGARLRALLLGSPEFQRR